MYRAHTPTYAQSDTSADGARLTLTKGALSALAIQDAFYHMDHVFAETSYDHPSARTECSHLNIHTQRDTNIDGARLTLTKGVKSALIIEDALYHMDHLFADTSYDHP